MIRRLRSLLWVRQLLVSIVVLWNGVLVPMKQCVVPLPTDVAPMRETILDQMLVTQAVNAQLIASYYFVLLLTR